MKKVLLIALATVTTSLFAAPMITGSPSMGFDPSAARGVSFNVVNRGYPQAPGLRGNAGLARANENLVAQGKTWTVPAYGAPSAANPHDAALIYDINMANSNMKRMNMYPMVK